MISDWSFVFVTVVLSLLASFKWVQSKERTHIEVCPLRTYLCCAWQLIGKHLSPSFTSPWVSHWGFVVATRFSQSQWKIVPHWAWISQKQRGRQCVIPILVLVQRKFIVWPIAMKMLWSICGKQWLASLWCASAKQHNIQQKQEISMLSLDWSGSQAWWVEFQFVSFWCQHNLFVMLPCTTFVFVLWIKRQTCDDFNTGRHNDCSNPHCSWNHRMSSWRCNDHLHLMNEVVIFPFPNHEHFLGFSFDNLMGVSWMLAPPDNQKHSDIIFKCFFDSWEFDIIGESDETFSQWHFWCNGWRCQFQKQSGKNQVALTSLEPSHNQEQTIGNWAKLVFGDNILGAAKQWQQTNFFGGECQA